MQNLAGPSFSPLQHRSNNLKDKGGPKDRDSSFSANKLLEDWILFGLACFQP